MDFENGWVTDDKELVEKVRKLTFKSAMAILRAHGKARRGQTNAPHDVVLNTLMGSILDGSIPREALEPKD